MVSLGLGGITKIVMHLTGRKVQFIKCFPSFEALTYSGGEELPNGDCPSSLKAHGNRNKVSSFLASISRLTKWTRKCAN